MNEYDRNSLQYQVIMRSFEDQISDKQIILQNLIYQANQKVLTNSQTHRYKRQQDKQLTVQIIKLCRKNIQQIQSMFADVHSYFIDLKLEFVYNFFVGTFRNMVMIYKLLSQKFITVIKAKKNKQQQQSQSVKSSKRNTQRMIQQIKNKNINQIQYFDKMIKSIELDEVQLSEKKKVIENRLFFQKKCIDSINPSDAVNQLQTLKKQIDRIILCSVRLIDDEEPLKNQYNTKIMENLNNNFNIQQQFCKGINTHTRQIFIKKMKDIAKKFKINIRQQFREEIIKQINQSKPKTQSIQVQTQPDPRYSSKDKNNYILQNQQLKKLKQSYRKQLIDLNKQLYTTQQQLKQHEKQLQISTQLMNKKTNQLQRLRKDYEYNLRRKDQTIQLINQDLIQTKNQYENKLQNLRKQQKITHKEGSENHGEESFFYDQSILTEQVFLGKLKNISMKTNRNSFFYQRQFKATKQQNQSLQKSLNLMLDTLKQQQLIRIDTINDLNQYLRIGKLPQKIEQISNELKKMKPIRQAKQKQESQIIIETSKKSKNRSIVPYTYVFAAKEEKGTQTNETMKSKSRTGQRIAEKNKGTEKNMQKNKLQFLKQQFMKKISSNDKKSKKMQHTRRSRLYLHQIEQLRNQQSQKNLKNQINFSMQNYGTVELTQKHHLKNSKWPSRNKSIFNRKDMSFQQYRFNREEANSKIDNLKKLAKKGYNYIQNPTQNITKRLKNNKSYEFDNINMQQNKENGSIIRIQSYQGTNQIKNIMNLIESTDNKDNCYKNIVKKLLQELTKLKKTQIMGQILQQVSKKKFLNNITNNKILNEKQVNSLLFCGL